jgi:hypothetical protein
LIVKATGEVYGRVGSSSGVAFNVAVVALANKNARVIWALLSRGDNYRPPRRFAPSSIAALGNQLSERSISPWLREVVLSMMGTGRTGPFQT